MTEFSWAGLVAKYGKKNVTVGAVVIGVIVLGLIGNAFSKSASENAAERAIEAATGGRVDIDSDGDEVTVKTDQGTYTTTDKLPSDFPSDVPVYAGAKILGSVASAGASEGGYFVTMETSASLNDVIAWYRNEVKGKGWTVVTDANINGSLMLSATKDSRALSVTVTEEDGKTAIGLAVANQ